MVRESAGAGGRARGPRLAQRPGETAQVREARRHARRRRALPQVDFFAIFVRLLIIMLKNAERREQEQRRRSSGGDADARKRR